MKRLIRKIRRVKLEKHQIQLIIDILKDIAQIFLAGWAVGPIATNYFKIWQVVLGVLLSIGFWYTSIELSNRINQNE